MTSGALPTLPTLPTELLDAIFASLGRKSVLSLAKTCKALNITALPHLYHTIRLLWKVDNEPSQQPRIVSLLHTIIAKPGLAAAVKSIELKAKGFTARDEKKLSSPKKVYGLATALVGLANEVLQQAKLPEPQKWNAAFKDKGLDSLIALLLIQCNNLQRLSLGAYFLHDNSFLPLALAHALNKPRGAELSNFNKLEHIDLGVDLDEYLGDDVFFLNIKASTILPVFQLPSLKIARVMLSNIPTAQQLPWSSVLAEGATAISELRLQRSRASVDTVTKLLEVCPKLSALEYDFRPKVGSERLDCGAFIQALKKCEKTLKHLRICLQPFSSNTLAPWEFGDGEYQVGSINAGFRNSGILETLEVSLVVLLGWSIASALPLSDVLPKTLKTLTIRDDCWEYEDWEWTDREYIKLFYPLLKHSHYKSVCPSLQYINLRLERSRDVDWSKESREKFKKMCNVKRVQCGILKTTIDVGEIGEPLSSGAPGGRKRMSERGAVLGSYFD